MRGKVRPLAALLLCLLSLELCRLAARAETKKTRKLIKLTKTLEPIFDTSFVPQPSHFEGGIKYTQIVYPDDPNKILHGQTAIVDLQGEVKKDVLRGRISEDERRTAIETVEHGLSPKFSVDLRKMEAKYAPDLAWMMEAAIGAARRRAVAEAAKGEAEMEKELKAPKLKPQIPLSAVTDKSGPDPQKALDAALAKSKERDRLKSRDADKALAAALSDSHRAATQLAVPDASPSGTASLRIPDLPKLPQVSLPVPTATVAAIPAIAKTDTKLAEDQMKAELLRAAEKQAEDKKKEELDTAAKLARKVAKEAQPVMDAILTFARELPQLRLPALNEKAVNDTQPDTAKQIDWDLWHRNFAELAKNPILEAVDKAGNPSGANTVEITVYADRRVEAKLSKSGTSTFDNAVLQAYKSLDKNPALTFPAGSKRKSISFLVDNKHEGAGKPLGVNSKPSVGDREVLRALPGK